MTESGNDALLSWGTGVGPFRVLKSATPDFYFDNHLVAQGLAASSASDPGALRPTSRSSYFLVEGFADLDPKGFFDNAPLTPAPVLTSLTPDSGPPGTEVLITGTGFLEDNSRMTVSFHRRFAIVDSATQTSLTVHVPAGALSGDVRVCIATDACSNSLSFHVTYGPAFQDISSISFESGTGSLWVAERGTVDAVWEIDSTGTVFARGSTLEPILAHPSPADGTGKIFYSSSLDSTGNQGVVRAVDSVTNADLAIESAGGGAGDWVRCEGIAARANQPGVMYFLDGVDNTVRQVIDGPGTNNNNFGSTGLLSFNRPAGARFDSSNNLYVSSTTHIYRITSTQVVSLVASGFTAAAGIDLQEVGGSPILAVADESTGEVFLVNVGTGEKVRVTSGLAGPVGVAFADNAAPGGTALYVAEPTRILRFPDPRLEFDRTDEQRILLSRDYASDVFPSTSQEDNAQINVQVRLNEAINPTGLTAYFRLLDPMDPSRYIAGATEDDNLPDSPAGSVTFSAPFNSEGVAKAILMVNGNNSGNNYQIEASLVGGAEFRPYAVSPIYTTWRRVYVEHDQMWASGAWVRLTSTGGAPPTATPVAVSDSSIFTEGEQVYILSGSTLATAKGESGTVSGVDEVLDVILVDTDPGPGVRGLAESYVGSATDDADPYSFVADVIDGPYGGEISLARAEVAFDDAFADWRILPNRGFLPAFSLVPQDGGAAGAYMSPRSALFFQARRNPEVGFPANTVQLVSAAFRVNPPLGVALGATVHTNDYSWIFDGRIEEVYSSVDRPKVREFVVAHELAHQYQVNPPVPPGDGHDEENSWLGTTLCLMHEPPNAVTEGVVKFHSPTGALTNDLMCIRSHANDLVIFEGCDVP